MPDTYTCITCQVLFKTPDLQREHYKLDWHRYNLKRKVANIPPVTYEEFELRAREHRETVEESNRDESQYCHCCSKFFNTKNAYNNHLNSKKHKLAQESYVEPEKKEEQGVLSDTDSFVKIEPSASDLKHQRKFVVLKPDDSGDEDIETDSEIEEVCCLYAWFKNFYTMI